MTFFPLCAGSLAAIPQAAISLAAITVVNIPLAKLMKNVNKRSLGSVLMER